MSINVSARTDPFNRLPKRLTLDEGASIAEIVSRSFDGNPSANDLISRGHVHVSINADIIPAGVWHVVRPKSGTLIAVTTTPAGGGGGKNVMMAVVAIAAIAFAPQLAFAFAGGMGPLTAGQFAVGAAIKSFGTSMLFSVAQNALIKPPSANMSGLGGASGVGNTSPTLSITGTRNQANPHGVVPRVYGKHRIYPPLATRPYVRSQKFGQTLYQLFDCGPGPLRVSQMKIGDRPIGDFEDIEVEVVNGSEEPSKLVGIFSSIQTQDSHNVLLESGVWQTFTSKINADHLAFEITFNGLVNISTQGAYRDQTVEFDAEYRIAGSSDSWVGVTDNLAPSRVDRTEVTATAYPINEYYTEFKTDYVYGGNGIDIKFLTPLSYRGAQLNTVTYDVYWRAEGASVWKYHDEVVAAQGVSVTSTITPPIDTKIEIKIELVEQVYLTGVPIPANDGTVSNTAVITPSFEYQSPSAAVVGVLSVTARTVRLYRRRYTISNLGGTDQWEVRIKRTTKDSTTQRVRDEATFTSLTTIEKDDPVNVDDHCLIALRIRATDQLNGMVSQFNCVAQSKLPTWTGSAWVDRYTRNPAWVFTDILRGTANARPLADSRLDLVAIKTWANACNAKPPQGDAVPDGFEAMAGDNYWRFNAVMDSASTVYEMLNAVAATGRASLAMIDGKFSVVRDTTKTTPVQMFTPRNSWGFKGVKAFVDLPHALKVQFVNPDNDWKQDEITVYADGYNLDGSNGLTSATKFETFSAWGCTDFKQAWREGRYHLAVGTLRPETFEMMVDVENLVCTRGDLVRVAHDVPRFGLKQGRINGVTTDGGGNVTALDLDEPITMDGVSSYGIRIRQPDGTFLTATVVTDNGDFSTISLSPSIPVGDIPAIGDLFAFGELNTETVELIITGINHSADLTARVVMQDYAPGVQTADSDIIPDYDPQQSFDPEVTAPPQVLDLRAVEAFTVTPSRVAEYSVTLSWDQAPGYYSPKFEAYIKSNGEWTHHGESETNSYTVSGVGRGDKLELAVSALASNGEHLSPKKAAKLTYTVVGVKPTDPTGFNLTISGDKIRAIWDADPDTVAEHWRIRYAAETVGAVWSDGVDLVPRVYTPGVDFPARNGTYMIKAVDPQGTESANYASSVTTAPGLNALNVVSTQTEHPAFSGDKVDTVVDAFGLRLDTSDLVSSWALMSDVPLISYGESGVAESGTYDFDTYLDLGAKYTSRVTAGIKVESVNLLNLVSSWPVVSELESISGTTNAKISAMLQISTTDDDPSGSPTWSDWTDFVVGDYAARAFKFRVVLTTDDPSTTPRVVELSITVDMPDVVQAGNDLTAAAGGTAVSFPDAFKNLDGVAISGDNLSTGDYAVVTAKSATGFTIQFKDSGGTGVERTYDYVAKGYGVEA